MTGTGTFYDQNRVAIGPGLHVVRLDCFNAERDLALAYNRARLTGRFAISISPTGE